MMADQLRDLADRCERGEVSDLVWAARLRGAGASGNDIRLNWFGTDLVAQGLTRRLVRVIDRYTEEE